MNKTRSVHFISIDTRHHSKSARHCFCNTFLSFFGELKVVVTFVFKTIFILNPFNLNLVYKGPSCNVVVADANVTLKASIKKLLKRAKNWLIAFSTGRTDTFRWEEWTFSCCSSVTGWNPLSTLSKRAANQTNLHKSSLSCSLHPSQCAFYFESCNTAMLVELTLFDKIIPLFWPSA